MRSLYALLVLCGLALSNTGCASLVSSGPDFVPVNSTPTGAKVTLDGIVIGKTPLIAVFSRTCEGVLTFELDGYEAKSLDVDKVLNGWFLGNALWFPIWPVVPLGLVIDVCTSSQGKYFDESDPCRADAARPRAVGSQR